MYMNICVHENYYTISATTIISTISTTTIISTISTTTIISTISTTTISTMCFLYCKCTTCSTMNCACLNRESSVNEVHPMD